MIVAFYKGGEHDCPNFRPTALLLTLAKVGERLFTVRMVSFLNRFDLLSSQQFGFCESMGTKNAIFDFIECLYSFLNVVEGF